MPLRFKLLVVILLAGSSSFAQKLNLADSLRCTQYEDALSKRALYRFPEKDAQFRGGEEGLSEYVQRRLAYERSQLKRQVIIFFTLVVEADGTISNVALKSAPSYTPNYAVESGLKILSRLPKAKPAECDGHKVAVRKIIPVVLVPDAS